MREIKFRAWDKEYLKFHRVESIEFSDGEVENVIIQNYMPVHISKIELMRYAGIKDKNGSEIYEGDICETRNVTFERYIISFYKGSFIFTNTDGTGFQDYLIMSKWQREILEVIGNIYENKELLDVK